MRPVTDVTRWSRVVSPNGNFTITAPYDDRLEDWAIELSGLPRMYDKLESDNLQALFGKQVVEIVHNYHNRYYHKRESAGDLIAKWMRRGPISLAAGFAMHKNFTVQADADINSITRRSREELLQSAREDSGRLIIARSTLIRS